MDPEYLEPGTTEDYCPKCGEVFVIDEGWINESDPLRQVYCPDCEE